MNMQQPVVYNYTVVYEQLSEGGYNVIVPAIPEICTYGETLEEAREMAKDAIQCFVESAIKAGEVVPQDVKSTVEELAITLA
jgi:predicted RNase H-like HicB family nuclease